MSRCLILTFTCIKGCSKVSLSWWPRVNTPKKFPGKRLFSCNCCLWQMEILLEIQKQMSLFVIFMSHIKTNSYNFILLNRMLDFLQCSVKDIHLGCVYRTVGLKLTFSESFLSVLNSALSVGPPHGLTVSVMCFLTWRWD